MGHKLKQSKTIETKTDFFYYALRNILLISIPLTLVFALILSLSHSSAASSGTDNIQMTLSTSCTVNAVVTAEHTVSLNGGQVDNNVGNTKISAYCNDNNGYGIYAIGSSGDVDGNTDLINSSNEYYNIRTGIYDSNNPVNPSSWAMKLTAGSGSGIDPVTGESVPTTPPTIINGYDNYSAIPNVYTLVAKRVSGTSMTTDTSISGSYLNTTYQIYANSAQPSGTYNGKVKYIMVHPSSNSQNTINGSFNMAFLKAGKNPAYKDSSGSYYFAMQDMTTDICNSVTRTGEVTAAQLVDKRDNKLYWIAKLADGHCWMTQNLDFDLAAYTNAQGQEVMKSLTSEDTDLTDHSLTGVYSQVDGYSYDENTGITTWIPASTAKTINFVGSDGVAVSGWVNSTDKPYSANDLNDLGIGHNSLGNLYNWTVSIASNNSASVSGSTFDNISMNPQNSICPKGWRLYTASNQSGSFTDSTNEFARLNYIYNSNKTDTDAGLISSPLYFTYPGYIRNNVLNKPNEMGVYWSSSNLNSLDAGRSYINSTEVSINNISIGNRGSGFSVRCVAR